METLLLVVVNLLSFLVDRGEARAVYSRGVYIGEKTDPYMRCYGLDVIKEKECFKEVAEEQAGLLPWWAWLLIGIGGFTLTVALCW